MAKQNPLTTPLPRKPAGAKWTVDFEELKRQYLDGPDYDINKFCKTRGYTEFTNRTKWKVAYGIDLNDWKKEWIRRQPHLQDLELAEDVINLRKIVAVQRIRYVKDWVKRAEFMKALLDGTLQSYGKQMQSNMIENKPFFMDPKVLSDLSRVALQLQEIESRALLLVGDNKMVPKISEDGDAEYVDAPPMMEVETMGSAKMSASETARLLVSYFDQVDKPREEEESKEADVEHNQS